jgi:hypothetical protein
MNQTNIETIDGITGEWRTVTSNKGCKIGQPVRWIFLEKKYGYGEQQLYFTNDRLNYLYFEKGQVQAFFPLPVKQKRKVAKVEIKYTVGGYFYHVKFGRYHYYYDGVITTHKSALRGAQRFCKAIGWEMEVVK